MFGLAAIAAAGEARASSLEMTQEEVCASADLVVIGTVTSRTSEWMANATGSIVTHVTIMVERVIHGPNPNLAWLGLDITGGTVQGITQTDLNSPRMPLDSRYLLILNMRPNKPPTLVGGSSGAVRLDPDATLDTLAAYQSLYDEVCGGS